MTLPEKHYHETSKLLRAIDKRKIAYWLLNQGYFPEQYVLPPSFQVNDFELCDKPYINLKEPPRRQLNCVSFPKSPLASRVFGIQHPHNYHDIVYWLIDEWDLVLDHIFCDDNLIYSYSIPIPLNSRCIGELSSLRAGRLIYEWIEMAERDLVAEAHKYRLLVRTDITNFYNSVYTHSIAWALHGREESLADKGNDLLGCKIDKLIQYANDRRTNGIPVGSAVSDLIAELLLSKVDQNASEKLRRQDIFFLGTRFKDDYRILSKSENDAKIILTVLSEELEKFNLVINEQKTNILHLPTGLFRHHNREYFPFSMRSKKRISFKTFEFNLLKVLDIHKSYPGTSLIEKFLSELFDNNYEFKVEFSQEAKNRHKQILKMISLLFLLKRESEKTLSHIMTILEALYTLFNSEYNIKEHFKEIIRIEIKLAIERKSEFEIIWYIFFSKYLGLGLDLKPLLDSNQDFKKNNLLASILLSSQRIYRDSNIILFKRPKDCRGVTLAKQLAVFDKHKE